LKIARAIGHRFAARAIAAVHELTDDARGVTLAWARNGSGRLAGPNLRIILGDV